VNRWTSTVSRFIFLVLAVETDAVQRFTRAQKVPLAITTGIGQDNYQVKSNDEIWEDLDTTTDELLRNLSYKV